MSKGFPALEIEEVSTMEEEQTKHLLVNEDSVDYLKKVDLIDAICQAPDKAARRDAIVDAAKALGKSTRTIKRMIQKVEQIGVATLAVGRKDKGQYLIPKIGKANTYLPLNRDTELFDWLDDQRDAKLCGYITSATGSGLLKACQLYRTQYVKRRGTLLEIPATVIYAEIDQHGGPTDLYCSIMEEIGHPLAHVGILRDLRARVWGTLKGYGVKILIIGNADYLTLEAFNELIDVFTKMRIPVILVGTYYLSDNILERKSLPYVRVHDSFL
ncbi:AAA family ATPase [uncultured Nostoc sp.]|uniref:ATP-binding protein n=1 Tax=uncultured Nostoc sp. TaxID=340711 RepID=UPI0035CAE4FF